MTNKHLSVLLKESITGLHINSGGIYVDCTLGRAGHSSEILKYLTVGKLYCFEQDQQAIDESQPILQKFKKENYEIIRANFVNLQSELAIRNVTKVNGILYDLGVSSPQLDQDIRGFSYHIDALLDMRMDQGQELTAKIVVNTYSQVELIRIFRIYGEETFAVKIAQNIVKTRAISEIVTTLQLVNIIKECLPQKILKKAKHPAKKVFQAIRIEVNQELAVLQASLKQASKLLDLEGRLVVISFHSLEDRIVKKFFQDLTTDPNYEVNKKLPIMSQYQSPFVIVTRKAIVPSEQEQTTNRRSSSAKLRILQRVKEDSS